MHRDDAGMAERGDMFVNRKQPNLILRKLIPALSGFGKAERFTPDLLVGDQFDFSEYGLDARALSIPGHSLGSIGILTGCGELFCGDLFENLKKPALNSIMDDPRAANASVDMLKKLEITAVYPGHGRPFTMDEFTQASP